MKISGDGVGDTIGAEKKLEGLGKKLFPDRNGLRSCNKERVFGSDAGENIPGDIPGSVAGAGDKIPGFRPTSIPSVISIRSPAALSLSLSLSDGLVFSIDASLAAGETAPAEGLGSAPEIEDDDDDDPVRRCTTSMKSLTVVWMTLGETV